MDAFQGKIDGHLDEPSIATGGTFAIHVDRDGSQLRPGSDSNGQRKHALSTGPAVSAG